MVSRPSKRLCVEEELKGVQETIFVEKGLDYTKDGNQPFNTSEIVPKLRPAFQSLKETCGSSWDPKFQPGIENGVFSKIPAELFPKFLKFLSPKVRGVVSQKMSLMARRI